MTNTEYSETGHPIFPDPGGWRDEPAPPARTVATPEQLDERPDPGEATNVVDGVAHSCTITADPGEPDLCGGCGREWPCEHAVRLRVAELPRLEPTEEEARLTRVAIDAVREASGLPPLDPTSRNYQQ